MKSHTSLDLLSNKVVLYAEDEVGIRDVVVEILELFFDKVIAVQDGFQALEQFEITPPDVLILDICMPKSDGLEVVQTIRKLNKNIPVIVLSAHAEHEYLWRAVELKITKYLVKPFNKEQLLGALKLCCEELNTHDEVIAFAQEIHYDVCKKIVTNHEQSYKLSKSESRLLEYLLENKHKVISFETLEEYLWGYDGEEHTKESIKYLIKDLRKKIGKEVIQNIYGVGYRLEI